VWLSNAIELVYENFGLMSPQHDSITQIKNDYRLARIRDKSKGLQNMYEKKAKQLIENYIDLLEEKNKIAITEANKKNQKSVQREHMFQQQLEELVPKYNFQVEENRRLHQEFQNLQTEAKQKRTYWKILNGVYHINVPLFWSVALPLLGGFFAFGLYAGTTKFDKNLIELSDSNRIFQSDIVSLKDTIKVRENGIEYMRHVSDSALNILGNVPYTEIVLDSIAFKKIQSTIEKAGAALYLNKDYRY
jgi:hypothetical protein